MSRSSCRNIEIKAKISDGDEFNEKLKIAKELTGDKDPRMLIQKDVFFKVEKGRLKLRYEEGKDPLLIHYDRNDSLGPKVSTYDIMEAPDGELLEKMLKNSIGVIGNLEKTRYLFIYDRTRIHLDIVKHKDTNFFGLEFEVKMSPNEHLEHGSVVAEDLMKKFLIEPEELLEGSYFEILNP